ncbi:palmdelphin isoform X4 [Poeciliopsis prolifica]|uniref:palmdelphin isoform X4 n=1 Tax=Poeciliopsis prolifica TaxID=188132 RepID=UPI002413F45C|nr:palmdelphin isoform X4 [Poeciliopsis prolifica]
MEEADLLKERLQAITDKRRIQEDIAKKRRRIEEEKLKLQYIKKKSLREQWLMDGLSQQSEEEQQAMRLQAQDEQQQSDQLQSNILRIEKEIEALEQKELSISFNEEIVLKRLKEVERTPEDIIKDLNTEFQPDVSYSPLKTQNISLFPQSKAEIPGVTEANSAGTKQATFAIQISVERNNRTGKNQVVSSATVSPDSIHERGLKVYDDGRKSVYALPPMEDTVPDGTLGEMSRTEVEELLHQATNQTVPAEIQFHPPVISVPYTGNSRPAMPKAPSQIYKEKSAFIQEQQPPPKPHQHFASGAFQPYEGAKLCCSNTSGQFKNNMNLTGRSDPGAKTSPGFPQSQADATNAEPGGPVSPTVRFDLMPATQPIHWGLERLLPKVIKDSTTADETQSDFDVHPATENTVKLFNTLPEVQEEEPVTMIFIGYDNALDEEEEDIQAELVIIGDSDGEEDYNVHHKCLDNLHYRDELLFYHPEGCTSKIFQPKVGLVRAAERGQPGGDSYTHCRDLELHKPTFIHKPGKGSCSTQDQGEAQPADSGFIRQQQLCSTTR